VLAGIAADFDGGEKFGVKLLGRKAPVGMSVLLNQIDQVIRADFRDRAGHACLAVIVRRDRQWPTAKVIISLFKIARSGARRLQRISSFVDASADAHIFSTGARHKLPDTDS